MPAARVQEEGVAPLSTGEKARLRLIETRMAERRKAVSEFFADLFVVLSERLYREKYQSFDAYCSERWGLSRSTVYRHIDHQQTVAVLGADPDLPKPTAESQTRPMTGLPDETKVKVYRDASGSAGGVPTAKAVKDAVNRIAPKRQPTIGSLKARGVIPESVEVEVREAEPEPEPEEVVDPGVSDDEWVESLPAWPKLSPTCRAWFKAEAVLFRQVTPHRVAFTNAISRMKAKAKRQAKHIGPWVSKLDRLLHMNGPERWVACAECKGTGVRPVFGGCDKCFGHGYHI